MSDSNSPRLNDSSSLRNLPHSFHFNPRMRSPANNLSPFTPRRSNTESSDFISFSSSSPADNRNHSFRHFNKSSPFGNRGKFRSNRSRNSFGSPNTSFNSSRNSSFSSVNSSFSSSQNYTPSSQRSSNYDSEDWEDSESYRSMFGNPWASLENELKQKYGDRLEPFPDIAVHRKQET